MTLPEFCTRFDPLLLQLAAEYQASVPKVESPLLQELITYPSKLFQGGKRVRPYLASVMYTALGGELTDDALRAFSSLEFFHLFCLVHDDIIDSGTMRHGVSTIHEHTRTRLNEEGRHGPISHLSEAYALLIGDLLFAWSLDSMGRFCPGTRRAKTRAQETFFAMINEVVVGQMLDVDLSTRSHASEKEIRQKMLLKTAGYTFSKPLLLGARLQTANKKVERFCEKFGTAVGLAFQWQDDLLDLDGNEHETKKSSFSDLETYQQTPFTQHVRTHGSAADQTVLDRLLGHHLSPDERVEARALFTRTGAFAAGKEEIKKLFAEAETVLEQATFLPERETLSNLLALLHHRHA